MEIINVHCHHHQHQLFFILCCFANLFVSCLENSPVLTLPNGGSLKGVMQETRGGKRYSAFFGVPYASVPVRFEAPVSYPSWEGIRDASNFGPVCPQLTGSHGHGPSFAVIGEEECLFLNVYTPNCTGKFPVLVYIHGGALMTGAGSHYGASYFLDEHDLILITVNYRLGALGFLSTQNEDIQGNAGLKDQNMALRWINENIVSFGGDPTRVTLMGESAGAASVAFHILSPMSRGLFQGAVMQSGTALDPQHFDRNPLEKAIELAESLDCPTSPTSDLVDCLRLVDFRKIVQIKMNQWHLDPLVQYPPTLETLREGQTVTDVFLAEDPWIIVEEGRFNKVPCVIGVVEDEGLLFHSAYILRNMELQRNMNEDWNYVAPVTLYYQNPHIPQDELNQISRTIRGFYFGNRKVEPTSSRNLTNLYSDRLFNWGTRSMALMMAKWVPVYAYIFGFMGDFSMLQLYYGNLFHGPMGVTHGDDLQYFFNSTRYPDLREGSRAEEMSKVLIRLWASFASTGNMLSSLHTLRIPWLPIGPEEIRRKRIKWCFIDTQSKILARDREPFMERMEFWDKIAKVLVEASKPTEKYKSELKGIDSFENDSNLFDNKDEL